MRPESLILLSETAYEPVREFLKPEKMEPVSTCKRKRT